MAEFVVTDQLKQFIGMSTDAIVYKVEEGAIQRFAQSVGDENPLYNDVEYAAQSNFGRLIAPPGFMGWPIDIRGFDVIKEFIIKLIMAGAPVGNLDGGVEYEFMTPIGAGDLLVAVTKLLNIEGRETKMGPTMVTTVETVFTNQNGVTALVMRNTYLNF